MPQLGAAELARRLAQNAEAVCRHYLSNGRREGRYWRIGDVRNTPGRSMYVRLSGPTSGKGASGKWTDAATGQHGDLLDIIRETCGLFDFPDVADEARRFLNLPLSGPQSAPRPDHQAKDSSSAPAGSPESARRLFAMSQPINGTIAEAYLHGRGITALHGAGCLRFHPNCYYRAESSADDISDIIIDTVPETWPALIAAVTDLAGAITGVQRTYLAAVGPDPSTFDKAPVDAPRRSMGHLLGNGVRFGVAADIMAAGEGIETMLSLRCLLPDMPIIAALSATHLGALLFPPSLRRLYVARDNDAAGEAAFASLAARAQAAEIEAVALLPRLRDFNDDLRHLGLADLRAALHVQLVAEDVARFIPGLDEAETG
jgi:hypothetical protein